MKVRSDNCKQTLVIYLNVIRAFRKALETVALKENNHDVR
jgi:hypothetical protein